MVLNAEKRTRLAELLTSREDVDVGVGTSAPPPPIAAHATSAPPSTPTVPAPSSSDPISAVPLVAVRVPPPSAPLEVNQGVALLMRILLRAQSLRGEKQRRWRPPTPSLLGVLAFSGITHLALPCLNIILRLKVGGRARLS